jgi:hypothetical protein
MLEQNIECHYHFVQENLITNEIDVKHIPNFQQANIVMKPIRKTKFEGL